MVPSTRWRGSHSLPPVHLPTAALLLWHVDTDIQVDDVAVRDGWVYVA